MTPYMIFLLFICNLVASIISNPTAPDNDASSVSQPYRGVDNQDLCEPMPQLLTGDTREDDQRRCFGDGDCPINFHCHLGYCLRSPRDSLKRVVRDDLQGKYCVVFLTREMWKEKLTSLPALQWASVAPVSTVLQDTTAGVEAAFKSHVLLRSHFSVKTAIVKDSPPADAQRCKHVTDCPVGKWCMDGFCWPFDQSTKLAARDADIGEASDDMKTQQRCHIHVQCGPGRLCINGWDLANARVTETVTLERSVWTADATIPTEAKTRNFEPSERKTP
ncbi:hypothetical protein ANOM_002425 [Aspergillus nomiae NRRL 13137]|uniref:Dickkopf N-terminal cysteine-rich domain-containing protein n=1 Tax=Aspergillus nomiae NRRL (strain ATCC 15546 / NRRL 13137 / CBS 260.88 / M93) TaxID=1509407 RepID=A0A0L1JBA6_ASPN3|nr:uncharacterized protein ANOM_002425 [Aspergillus nomiae NRRL 13137]KNG88997.1 hypothetical protein ANOM_002425 [Aspergillus nomiae NRRL 13137]